MDFCQQDYDGLRIYGRALDEVEIRELYQRREETTMIEFIVGAAVVGAGVVAMKVFRLKLQSPLRIRGGLKLRLPIAKR